MYFVIKIDNRYLAPPKDDTWDAEIKTWTSDIDEARVGTIDEMSRLSRYITKPGTIVITKVKILESK